MNMIAARPARAVQVTLKLLVRPVVASMGADLAQTWQAIRVLHLRGALHLVQIYAVFSALPGRRTDRCYDFPLFLWISLCPNLRCLPHGPRLACGTHAALWEPSHA